MSRGQPTTIYSGHVLEQCSCGIWRCRLARVLGDGTGGANVRTWGLMSRQTE